MSEVPPATPRRRRVKRVARGAALLLGLALAGYFLLPWTVPWPDALNHEVPAGVRLTDRHGTPLRRLLAEGRRAGDTLSLTEIPKALIEATLAAEDQGFFSHGGIDPLALTRALRDGLQAGRRVSGASTITQQLAKLAHPRASKIRARQLSRLTFYRRHLA